MDLTQVALKDLPRANEALCHGATRSCPEDFLVDESVVVKASDGGSYIWLLMRKRNLNTRWVGLGLARHFGVPGKEVSWAGLKDRRAVTTQWFCVRCAGAAPLRAWFEPGTALLQSVRSRDALRPGDHSGNQFAIRIRNVSDRAMLETALRGMQLRGRVPNYFGPQRFGRGGANLQALQAWSLRRARPKDRFEQSLWLSAGRAWLFNLALAERVAAGDWHTSVPGDWVVAGVAEGPLWGGGRPLQQGAASARSLAAWREHGWLMELLIARGMNHATRPWTLKVDGLTWHWHNAQDVTLSFALAPGGYATTVLRELLLESMVESMLDVDADDDMSEAV